MTEAAEIDSLAHRLRPLYSRFLGHRPKEFLLTAHSHQAWPDVSLDAQIEAWEDAARLVDRKWDRVFGEILPKFQTETARRLGTSRAPDLAVAGSTHELVYRLASCFPPNASVVTTDQEFHSLRRQLDRLAENGATIIAVAVSPPDDPEGSTFPARFTEALQTHRPTWAALSMVFFTNARIVLELPEILKAAESLDIPVLVDAYHAYNTVPLEVDRWPGTVFVTAGGYKYAQAGEGACFMLLPADAERFRPRYTGWFSDFGGLSSADRTVRYGSGGARFLGSTFDPSGLYRGLRTLEHFEEHGLSVEVLRGQSLRQTEHLIQGALDRDLASRGLRLASPRAPERRAGFVAFETSDGQRWVESLEKRGVMTDARGALLRLGPAPYTTVAELDGALEALGQALPER